MKKLFFFKKIDPEQEKGSTTVRLKIKSYSRVVEIAEQAALPVVQVLSDLVDFALEHTEVITDETF